MEVFTHQGRTRGLSQARTPTQTRVLPKYSKPQQTQELTQVGDPRH